MISHAAAAEAALLEMADAERAVLLRRFFRTGPGEYGEGDMFLGIRVPALRKLSRTLRGTTTSEMVALLHSRYHEARLLALLAMVDAYRHGTAEGRQQLFDAYLANTRWINNWDLVDTSAEHIIGAHLRDRDRSVLRKLAASPSLWERRMAMLATFHFIRVHDFEDTLSIAVLLLSDSHDLIHKAVGWMLREVGTRNRPVLDHFLQQHCTRMPRTMLRYAIEKHDQTSRQKYMRGDTGRE